MYNPYDAYDRNEWYKADAIIESRRPVRPRFNTPQSDYKENLRALAKGVADKLKGVSND